MNLLGCLILLASCHQLYAQSAAIAYVASNQYDWLYNDAGTGARVDLSIWRPKLMAGYFALGDVAKTLHSPPTTTAVQVKEIADGALAMPTGSEEIWNDRGSGGRYDVRIMKLKAPAGYVCLGNVAVQGYNSLPDYSLYRCVKERFVKNGAYQFIWNDSGSGAHLDFSAWLITSASSTGLSPGSFNSHRSHRTLRCCPKVLNVDFLKQERYLVSDFPLCKLNRMGRGYAGSEYMTASSQTCKPWSQMSLRQRKSLGGSSPPVPLEANYCRNPNGRPNGPWCFHGSGDNDWAYCRIPICKPSATCTTSQKGENYVGTHSITKSGRTCKRWDTQSSYSDDQFPDATVQDAANYCRNPQGQKDGVWCFTTDRTKPWEYCDVSVCSNCRDTTDGRGYAGSKAKTTGGTTCLPWVTTNFRNSQLFPDASVSKARNYCRNPDRDPAGPWCLISHGGRRLKSRCGLPMCQARGQGNSKQGSIRHVLHIGIDGLHSTCWQRASGRVPNLRRLAATGSYTLHNARAEVITSSGPNWGAHLCGMGIQSTGITSNSWSPPWKGAHVAISPVNGKTYPMPCAFNYLKGTDQNVRTGLFYNWHWFDNLGNGGIPGSVDQQYTSSDAAVVAKASAYLKNVLESGDRSYTFVHMDQVDGAGHASSWCSGHYLSAVNKVDALVGKLLQAVGTKPVLIMLSSDHGGDRGHGHMRDSNVLIPMFIKGPGVKRNYQLQKPVRNRDILPTAAWALGIQASPFWDGDVMKEAFEE